MKNTYEISGNTKPYESKIRAAKGVFDRVKKVWTVDLYKSDSLFRYKGAMTFTQIEKTSKPASGVCPICGTYCDGDCRS